MAQTNQIELLYHDYKAGNFYIYSTMMVHINPKKSLSYQAMSSAFMFPISGKAQIQLENHAILAKPGKMIYIPYASHLDISVESEENFSYINVFHQFIKRPIFEIDISNNFDDILKTLTEMVKISDYRGVLHNNKQTEKLFMLLQSQDTDALISDYVIIKDLIEYINSHYYEDINLEKLANLSGLKKSKVSYLFQKYINKRPINYLIDYRLNIAKDLLEKTDLLVSEIAEKVGYNDPFYFSRLFKKHRGICPADIRQRRAD